MVNNQYDGFLRKDKLEYNNYNMNSLDYKIKDSYNDLIGKKDYISDIYDYGLNNIIKTPSRNSTNNTYIPINWGRDEVTVSENAYFQPTPEEVQRVLDAMHMVADLPEEQREMLAKATQELRYFFDGQVRATFGGTRHFNAIRCLNDPRRTDVSGPLGLENVQLAGEEFFGLNRFMHNYPDVADMQWWAVYQGGSWTLDTWNPQGEHLDTGLNGWGELVGSVIKLNGKVLTPTEAIGFYRTTKLRNERGFMDEDVFNTTRAFVNHISREGSLPSSIAGNAELLHDLGLVDARGRTLTYTGESMNNINMTARQRKQRQVDETDESIRRIIVPTLFE